MSSCLIFDMSTSQFPFGEYPTHDYGDRKVLIRKRMEYRTERECKIMTDKLDILTKICHRNVINVRSVDKSEEGAINIFYPYVSHGLYGSILYFTADMFKYMNKQLIQLAIHLAKNYILTSFNPNRCGVVFNEDNFILKYYLPLNEIVITDSISMLERSVQLFKVQAMHLLDTISQNYFITDLSPPKYIEPSCSPKKEPKNRRDTQPFLQFSSGKRKASNESSLNFQKRKFSNMVSFESSRKKSQDSTAYSENRISYLKETLKSYKLVSERKRIEHERQLLSKTVYGLRHRSEYVLRIFSYIKKELYANVTLARLLRCCLNL